MRIEPRLAPEAADLLEAELPDYGRLHRDGDLAVTGFEGDDPVGLVSGRRLVEPGMALIEHLLVRPKYQGGLRILRLYRAWERLARDAGMRRAVGGLDVAKGFMHGVIRRTGWVRYDATDRHEWYVRELGARAREPREATEG